MSSEIHTNEEGHVTVVRSCMVNLDPIDKWYTTKNTPFLLILYYYHTEYTLTEKGTRKTYAPKTFYRCSFCIDTKQNFEDLAHRIGSDNPAALFNLSSLGLENFGLKVKSIMTNKQFERWLLLKIRKKYYSFDEFLHGHKECYRIHVMPSGHRVRKYQTSVGAFEGTRPYIKDYIYNGTPYTLEDPLKIPHGVWISEDLKILPRRKPKLVK